MPPWPMLKLSEENDQTNATHTTRLHSEKKSDGTRCATSDGNKDFIDNFSLHIGLCNQVSCEAFEFCCY